MPFFIFQHQVSVEIQIFGDGILFPCSAFHITFFAFVSHCVIVSDKILQELMTNVSSSHPTTVFFVSLPLFYEACVNLSVTFVQTVIFMISSPCKLVKEVDDL